MTDPEPHVALRKWRHHITRVETLVILTSVSAVLGLTSPFETSSYFNLPARLAYWATISFVCYIWGSFVSIVLSERLATWGAIVRVLISGVITAVGITGFVLGINALVLPARPDTPELARLLPIFFAISIIVTATMAYLTQSRKTPEVQAQPDQPPQTQPDAQTAMERTTPPLLDRLPLEKRAALVALCVEDHYVRIHTSAGEEMILMRLSDAVREVGDTFGAQVHRSYWAAFDQVQSVRREGDRAILTMNTGLEVPVSRANLPKIKEAGLLPR